LKDFKDILQSFEPISLKEMDNVKLLNRADTKFIFNADLLTEILEEARSHYRVLTTETGRLNSYRTLYFDTENLASYITHHNGKLNRIKVRIREYIDSKIVYLEIKLKTNKGKTEKSRMKLPAFDTNLDAVSKKFIEDNSFYKADEIKPVLVNKFSRITLVHKTKKERATLDLNIVLSNVKGDKKKGLPHLIIAEVKQEKASVNSDFIQIMKKRYIRQNSMSKYCTGTIFMNEGVKSNNFKELILKINKLKNDRSLIA